jgi:2-polyprenyl-3-methyl-5-hydroxy-6-metoxy-1,4-benzoquinol methylase
MIEFLNIKTPLANLINEKCNELFVALPNLDIDALPFEPFFKMYFKKCHLERGHFTLETSAKLLYDAILATGKPHQEVVMMDYGAGLGTLYLLAKMIGVKKIIYNDLILEFATPAMAVDKALGIVMDEYIIGDTEATCKILQEKNIECDVIVSRNVIEHIYNLEEYFKIIFQYQPKAILYNSTTANWNNPAAHAQHIYLHYKAKPILIDKKIAKIKTHIPSIDDMSAKTLAYFLIQHGGVEFDEAVAKYKLDKIMPKHKGDYTNVCDETGNWREHLLPYKKYRALAPQYNLEFLPGFWDTHYKNPIKKYLGKTMNFISKVLGKKGVWSASFIYVVARPKVKFQ